MKNSKFILFDFDGTVADTVWPIVEMLNDLSGRFGYRKIDKKLFEKLRGKRNQEALKETGIPPYKVLLIARSVWRETHRRLPAIQPVEGIKGALDDLKREGYRFGIVTTGSRKNVVEFLEMRDLRDFEFVQSGRQFFGKHKIIRRLLRKYKLRPQDVVYIGDQTSDIEAAREVGVKVVAVGWGFNSEKILREQEPDAFIQKPSELKRVFKSL